VRKSRCLTPDRSVSALHRQIDQHLHENIGPGLQILAGGELPDVVADAVGAGHEDHAGRTDPSKRRNWKLDADGAEAIQTLLSPLAGVRAEGTARKGRPPGDGAVGARRRILAGCLGAHRSPRPARTGTPAARLRPPALRRRPAGRARRATADRPPAQARPGRAHPAHPLAARTHQTHRRAGPAAQTTPAPLLRGSRPQPAVGPAITTLAPARTGWGRRRTT
jgi:hypothetical protein